MQWSKDSTLAEEDKYILVKFCQSIYITEQTKEVLLFCYTSRVWVSNISPLILGEQILACELTDHILEFVFSAHVKSSLKVKQQRWDNKVSQFTGIGDITLEARQSTQRDVYYVGAILSRWEMNNIKST